MLNMSPSMLNEMFHLLKIATTHPYFELLSLFCLSLPYLTRLLNIGVKYHNFHISFDAKFIKHKVSSYDILFGCTVKANLGFNSMIL